MIGNRDFKAGDILVASDNVLHIPRGYMGHSCIVVTSNQIVEATDTLPYIRLLPIEKFLLDHPVHAQYRPLSAEMGERAAFCALDYQRKYDQSLKRGISEPVFSLMGRSQLSDPWETIYCSKLVWLSYYYGANYEFPNDFFLFTPEDLDTLLQRDSNFTMVYRHPDVYFKVDT